MEKKMFGADVLEDGNLVAEISNLAWLFAPSMFSNDLGWWRIIETKRDNEGDFMFWKYENMSTGQKLTVFND
jgi:hypothetical protein